MQDDSLMVRKFMEVKRLSQTALAKNAGVSQSTVCRILTNAPQRHGGARKKLLDYVETNSANLPVTDDAHSLVIKVFNQVWDKTDSHAEAIAKVIKSLSSFELKKLSKKGVNLDGKR